MNLCGISWTFYAEGFNEYPNSNQCYPYYYDASDDPFTYFPSLTESETADYNFRDFSDFKADLKEKKLPAVSYVKALGIHSEHPEFPGSLLTGQMLSNEIYELIMNSEHYKDNTVLFLVPDESGGFYDHKSPPGVNKVDGYQYGPRTHLVALGNLVKKNYVTHVQMESSSLIRFIEWNWIGKEGLLWSRDMLTNNIGDMIDKDKAGIQIPSINPLTMEDLEKKINKRKSSIQNDSNTISSFFNGKYVNDLYSNSLNLRKDGMALRSFTMNDFGLVRVDNSNLRKRMKFSNTRQKRFENW